MHINPVDGARVDRQFPRHDRKQLPAGMVEHVHHGDTARRTEGVPGSHAREPVDGEVVFSSELNVFFVRVEPEIGVLFFFASVMNTARAFIDGERLGGGDDV